MTQYHAIGLLYQMRAHDRMAVVKMVQQYAQPGVVKNAAGVVLLVRLAAKIAHEDPNLRKPMVALLEGWLRHKAEMVNFEAAKAICELPDVTDQEAAQVISGKFTCWERIGVDTDIHSYGTLPRLSPQRLQIHRHPHPPQLRLDPSQDCQPMQRRD